MRDGASHSAFSKKPDQRKDWEYNRCGSFGEMSHKVVIKPGVSQYILSASYIDISLGPFREKKTHNHTHEIPLQATKWP